MSNAQALDNSAKEINELVLNLCKQTKSAASTLAQTPTTTINAALKTLADKLRAQSQDILTANKTDVENAQKNGLSDALIDRLKLDDDRIDGIAKSVETVIQLDDPTQKILWEQNRPNGLKIQRISCPIGVLGMIYESRPNVTIDAAILCLKSHNAVILRGGSESINSAAALHKIIQDALNEHNIPKECVAMIPTKDREAVGAMLRANQYIDAIIPRGGKSLIERVMNDAKMPVFGHLEGICHIYVDEHADIRKALKITLNAKMRRTGICGAMETLLINSNINDEDATAILQNLRDNECQLVGDEKAQVLDKRITPASKEDWSTEYLAPKLSVKFVQNIDEAINHINTYGTHHTDSIITESETAAAQFLNNVDSGIVMHNTSTQFADGGEFGMGAEIGIATGKMHARGPVGLEQLCSYKYHVKGNGQTRP